MKALKLIFALMWRIKSGDRICGPVRPTPDWSEKAEVAVQTWKGTVICLGNRANVFS